LALKYCANGFVPHCVGLPTWCDKKHHEYACDKKTRVSKNTLILG
jgi:hypothetical protein